MDAVRKKELCTMDDIKPDISLSCHKAKLDDADMLEQYDYGKKCQH